MRVAVVDVGANTLRLLVATRDALGRVEPVREDRRQLGLGDEIERRGGVIGRDKLDDAAAIAEAYVRRARKLGALDVQILVTSPGRQAENGEELVAALAEATALPVRVLDADEEGELAWRGAVAAAESLPESVAVCDVGGGSAQLVVGTTTAGPVWSRSVDIGSLRLTRRALLDDPPTALQIAEARRLVADAFADVAPPLPQAALATGGTARALRRLCGRELDAPDLERALLRVAERSSREIAKDFDVDRARARTLTAGTILLAEVQRRLNTTLVVARGGLREGAALELFAARLSATA